MDNKILLGFLIFGIVLSFFSCGRKVAGKNSESGSAVEWEEKDWGIYSNPYQVVGTVKQGNVSHFASLCRYPIIRDYPLKDIRDSADMVRRYPVIFDDSLINKISHTTPEDWEEYGWRGLTFGQGEYLWIDENIYAITYQSAKEKEELDSLILRDLSTLPPALAKGWKPEICFLDSVDSTVYRIDLKDKPGEDDEEEIRVIICNLQNIGQENKWEIIEGVKRIEGSMGVRSYYFPMKRGEVYSISYIWQEDQAFLSDSSADDYRDLQKVYWLTLNNL